MNIQVVRLTQVKLLKIKSTHEEIIPLAVMDVNLKVVVLNRDHLKERVESRLNHLEDIGVVKCQQEVIKTIRYF